MKGENLQNHTLIKIEMFSDLLFLKDDKQF